MKPIDLVRMVGGIDLADPDTKIDPDRFIKSYVIDEFADVKPKMSGRVSLKAPSSQARLFFAYKAGRTRPNAPVLCSLCGDPLRDLEPFAVERVDDGPNLTYHTKCIPADN